MFVSRALLGLGLLGVAVLAHADVSVQGPVEHGIFITPQRALEPGQRVIASAPETLGGETVVPARLGVKFGLRYQLAGKRADDTPLTLLYFTPGVITPDGKRHDKFEVTQKMVPAAPHDVMAFEFTERHELVKGPWTFMVFQGDHKLAEQTFQVQ